jgi:hypothetical protein
MELCGALDSKTANRIMETFAYVNMAFGQTMYVYSDVDDAAYMLTQAAQAKRLFLSPSSGFCVTVKNRVAQQVPTFQCCLCCVAVTSKFAGSDGEDMCCDACDTILNIPLRMRRRDRLA